MKRQTYLNIRKAIFLYASVAAMALALPACVKGFKAEVKDATAGSSRINTDPTAVTAQRFEMTLSSESSMSIIKLVTDADPKAQAILDNPKNTGAIQVSESFDLSLIKLDSNQSESGAGSLIRFQIVLLAPEKVELSFESQDAHLNLIPSSGGLPAIKGYWEIRDGPVRTRLYINAVVNRNFVSISDPYMLDGNIEIMVGGSTLQLGNFSIPLCAVIDNPTAFNIPDLTCK